jgi:hypothetical protein
MKRATQRLLTALSAALLLASPAFAQVVQGLDGRWEGPMELGNGIKLTGVFRIATKDGKTTVLMDSPEQGAKDIPATVTREGDTVTFTVPMGGLTYTAKLSADGKTLTGNMSQGPGVIPVTMTQKPAGAVTAITTPAVAGLDGRWEGTMSTPGGDLLIALRIATAAGKTTTLLDSVTQAAMNIPALTTRTGQQVSVDVPGVGGKYTGTLSADGKTIDGFWDQNGATLDLKLTKK